jgi:hypothetical protein
MLTAAIAIVSCVDPLRSDPLGPSLVDSKSTVDRRVEGSAAAADVDESGGNWWLGGRIESNPMR